jgi:uncharacterized protein DUF4375
VRVLLLCIVVLALVAVGCGDRSSNTGHYLVPAGDRAVLADTYDRMLTQLEHSNTDDPGYVPPAATPGQRMLYLLFFVDDEIANGGLYQVYWNLPGGFVNEAAQDALRIGAGRWGHLVEQAGHRLFPNGVPDSVASQRAAIGCPGYCDKQRLDRLNSQWRDGSLRAPLLRYVKRHPTEFYERS